VLIWLEVGKFGYFRKKFLQDPQVPLQWVKEQVAIIVGLLNWLLYRRLDPSESSTKLLKPPAEGRFVALSLQFDGYYQFACRLFWCLGHEAAFFPVMFPAG